MISACRHLTALQMLKMSHACWMGWDLSLPDGFWGPGMLRELSGGGRSLRAGEQTAALMLLLVPPAGAATSPCPPLECRDPGVEAPAWQEGFELCLGADPAAVPVGSASVPHPKPVPTMGAALICEGSLLEVGCWAQKHPSWLALIFVFRIPFYFLVSEMSGVS